MNWIDEASGPDGTVAAERDDLLVRIAKTDATAFGSLYDRYFPAIYRYAYHRLGNQPDAEDIASQTFYLAWANFERYEWRGVPFVAWLYRIAANVVVDLKRRQKQTASLDEARDILDRGPGPAAAAEKAERNALLVRAVESLPQHQRGCWLGSKQVFQPKRCLGRPPSASVTNSGEMSETLLGGSLPKWVLRRFKVMRTKSLQGGRSSCEILDSAGDGGNPAWQRLYFPVSREGAR